MRAETAWIFFVVLAVGFLSLGPGKAPVREGYAVFRQEVNRMMESLDYRLRTCENQAIILGHAIQQLALLSRAPLSPRDLVQKLNLKVPDLSPHDPSQQADLEIAVERVLGVLVEGVAHAVAGSAGTAYPGEVAEQIRSLMASCGIAS